MAVGLSRADANAGDQLPWESLLDEEFRLLCFHTVSPVSRRHRTPVDLAQFRQIGSVLTVARPCIGQRERPTQPVVLCPRNGLAKIGFQMNDGLLSPTIFQLGMVSHVNQVEHDGTWAEVEGNTATDTQTRVAVQRANQTPLLDSAHSDHGSRGRTMSHVRVAQEPILGNDRLQSVYMYDVVDLRIRRHRRVHWGFWRIIGIPDGVSTIG